MLVTLHTCITLLIAVTKSVIKSIKREEVLIVAGVLKEY